MVSLRDDAARANARLRERVPPEKLLHPVPGHRRFLRAAAQPLLPRTGGLVSERTERPQVADDAVVRVVTAGSRDRRRFGLLDSTHFVRGVVSSIWRAECDSTPIRVSNTAYVAYLLPCPGSIACELSRDYLSSGHFARRNHRCSSRRSAPHPIRLTRWCEKRRICRGKEVTPDPRFASRWLCDSRATGAKGDHAESSR